MEFTSPGTRSPDTEEAILSDQKSDISKSSINYGTLSISMNDKYRYSNYEEEKEEMDYDFEESNDIEDEKEEGEVGIKGRDENEKEAVKGDHQIEDEDEEIDFNYQEKKRKEAENKKLLEEEMIIESKIKERKERKGIMSLTRGEKLEKDSITETTKYWKEKEDFCQNLPDKDHFQSIRTFFLTEKVRHDISTRFIPHITKLILLYL